MMLEAAKRRLSPSPVIRQWRAACVFARPTTSYEGELNSIKALRLVEVHGEGPGG